VVGTRRNDDAAAQIRQGDSAAHIGADKVSLNRVSITILKIYSRDVLVTRNDVPRARRGPSDGVVGRAVKNEYPFTAVSQRSSATAVRANKISLDQVSGCARASDRYALNSVS